MTVERSLLSQAVDIHLAFGPEARVPAAERLKAAHPELSSARAEALTAEASSICSEGFSLAERAWHGEMSPDEGRTKLGQMFPMLDEAALDHLWMKGGYFAWHG